MQKLTILLAAVLSVIAAPVACANETRDYLFGDLAISYDPVHWRFESISAGDPLRAQPATFEARCLDCRGAGFVSISVGDIAREESEVVLDPMWARDRSHTTMKVGEFTFGVTTIRSPCRNYVPPSSTARVAYKGKTYSFHSGTIVGCRGSTGVESERFEELLRGLHPRD